MDEEKEEKALRFKKLCIKILAQSGNCAASQHDFKETESIQEMCNVWHTYWHGLITEVPEQVMQAFNLYYSDFKEEINSAGIYYNEEHPNAVVLVGDSEEPIHLYNTRNAYVLGKAKVVLHGKSTALCLNPNCQIELLDMSRATVKQGYGIARNNSQLITLCNADCYDTSTVHITNGTLHDNGHIAIYAYGKAVIETFTDRLIYLYDKSIIKTR